MAQSFIAGMTSYENQSLADIVEDIDCWVAYSEQVKEDICGLLSKLKSTKFYSEIPYDYKAMIHEMPQICQTNIDDMKRTLEAIQSRTLTNGIVELFRKVGRRAIENGEENKKYYKSRDDGYWHDYGNPDFRMVEEIYAMFGDYCATLWDVTNAASRLRDYVDIPKEVTTMKFEDNSVNIGDGNKFKKNNFHSKNTIISGVDAKETLLSKIRWQIVIPIAVGVIIAAIAFYLGIN